MNRRKTNEEFIFEAEKKHIDANNKPIYIYTQVDYINAKTKVKIECKVHGNFEQTPDNHLKGKGCSKCYGNVKKTNSSFVFEAEKKHIDIKGETLYDYKKVIYQGMNKNVIIICKVHGNFEQTPNNHLKGHGCAKCYGNEKKTIKEFIFESEKKHIDENGESLYDYSKVFLDFKNNQTKVKLLCKIEGHGEFMQSPNVHLKGSGCPKCGIVKKANKRRKTKEEFILEAEKKHIDENGEPLYFYNKVDYKNTHSKVIITFKIKGHEEFKQEPNHHLKGNGCPKCPIGKQFSKISIDWLESFAKDNNVYILHGANEGEFLIPNSRFKADGYCKETNTIFEFHGCFWHGCLKCFPNQNEENRLLKKTYGELYESTFKKKQWIFSQNYNYVEIWECEWKKN
jgi:hypothetical protein